MNPWVEKSLEKGNATHSSIIPWTVQSMGSQRVEPVERLSLSLYNHEGFDLSHR